MIELQNLKAGYNGKVVLSLTGLTLGDGEHCLITGRSGSGKTTLLYALCGLLAPISGSIRVNGSEITALSHSQLDAFRGCHIGIIYQTLHTVKALSVLDNLLLVQYAAGVPQDKGKAEALLARLGLLDYRHRKPDTLSQGQQQRVAIARAAVNSPKIIVGDEPTSALDDEACETVIGLLLGVAKTCAASLIIATHDQRIKKYFQRHIALGGVQ